MIVGLGNPGLAYQYTKHNLAFHLLEAFAEKEEGCWKKNCISKIAQLRQAEQLVILQMPETSMNLSGAAVQKSMLYYKIEKHDLLVVCDDVNLPFGSLRLRSRGKSGGHKGLQSVMENVKSQEICRLRLGVGRDIKKPLVKDVLSSFSKEQLNQLPAFLKKGCSAIEAFLTRPIQSAIEQVALLNQMK